MDEVHRFNRSQQDGFLPYVEDGTVTLVGATTENPSFELNAALLSRCQVLILRRLDHQALETLIERAETEVGRPLPVTGEARSALIASADGEAASCSTKPKPCSMSSWRSRSILQASLPCSTAASPSTTRTARHYNLISALHKSLRGSDPQAALYYLARMLVAGEEPLYLLRRLVRFASEDIGLADPKALVQCLAAKDAYNFLGSPEGELAIVQACLYLATAPKSNAAYAAQKTAWRSAKETGSLMPPAHILNAPTRLMKDIGYGKGYAYDHDADEGFSGADYWPEEMEHETFYEPTIVALNPRSRSFAYWNEMQAKQAGDSNDNEESRCTGLTAHGLLARPVFCGGRAFCSRSSSWLSPISSPRRCNGRSPGASTRSRCSSAIRRRAENRLGPSLAVLPIGWCGWSG